MWEKKTIRTRIQRYKLYKSGKTWITALIFAVALSVPINSVVYSDSTTTTASNYNNSSTTNINNSNFLDFFSIINNNYTKYDANSGILKLTTGSQQAGGVTFKNDIDLSKPFSMDFDINVGSGNVADGIGIAFYSGDRNQIGKKAGNLGIYGIPNAFGWKLDTWTNPESNKNLLYGQNDKGLSNPYAAFVTTDNSGYGTIDQSSDNTYKALPSTIKDGQFHHVSVQYDGNMNITITLNYNKDYTFTKNLNGIVPINQPLHLNISSSTGGYATTHQVKFNSMSYYQSSTPPTVNKIYDSDSSISGTGVAGSNINIYDDNDKFIGSTIVSDNGTWSFTINNNLLKEGAKYKFTQKSPNQGESITTSSKVLHDPNIDDQKTAQKKSLQEEHDKIVNDIKNDPTLTTDEKNKQIGDADKSLTDGQTNIDNATTADAVNKAASDGQKAIDDAHQLVTPTTSKPVINSGNNVTIKAGDHFDPTTGVTASDTQDGDLTNQLQTTITNANGQLVSVQDAVKTPGQYSITYKVTNKAGESTTVSKSFTVDAVQEPVAPTTSQPVINSGNNVTIKAGDHFDPTTGVTASDTQRKHDNVLLPKTFTDERRDTILISLLASLGGFMMTFSKINPFSKNKK